jgi:hypothetical protein
MKWRGVHYMVTIVKGLVYPAWYALTKKKPTPGYYEVSRNKDYYDAMVDPRDEFLRSVVAAGVAVSEYFALRALMVEMPDPITAVTAGVLFYHGMGITRISISGCCNECLACNREDLASSELSDRSGCCYLYCRGSCKT